MSVLEWCSLESLHYQCAGSNFTTDGNQGEVAHQAPCREQYLRSGCKVPPQEESASSLRMVPHQFSFCMWDFVSNRNINGGDRIDEFRADYSPAYR